MKLHALALCAALLAMPGLALAIPEGINPDDYDFVDCIDDWSCFGFDSGLLVNGVPFTYWHDITDDGVPPNVAAEAWLQLDFTNDWSDSYYYGMFVKWDLREYVRLAYEDGVGFVEVDPNDVDNGYYDIQIDVLTGLNDDGLLDVQLIVYNNLCTGTIWLDHSCLYGNFEVGQPPIPEPVTFGSVMLGLCGLGRYVRRRIRA